MKIKSNTTNNDLPWRFSLYQRPSSKDNETNSSSGSCHGSDVSWQETGHKLQFWVGSLTEVPDGSKRRCTFARRDEVLWTGM